MILDTNALSALAEGNRDLFRAIRFAPRLSVTLISLGEFRYGIARSRRGDELQAWLDAFLGRAQVLSPTLATLPHYAAIRAELKANGTPIPANDCWIAALVREHRLPFVSRDRHFDAVAGIERVEW
jgi:tRNA(fMet)-specific endonuclease VapC